MPALLRLVLRPVMIFLLLLAGFFAGRIGAINGAGYPLAFGVSLLALLGLTVLWWRARPPKPKIDLEQALQAANERTRAIAELSTVLGATLEHQKVLEAVLAVGAVGLREGSEYGRLVSMALLFRGGLLYVATSRRLTLRDQSLTTAGTAGYLNQALQTAEPIFAGNCRNDPELSYFASYQEARSILILPLRTGLNNYGLLVYGAQASNAFTSNQTELLSALAAQATLALHNAVLYQNIQQEKERLLVIEEEARRKLARDLHDGPTQKISAVAMRLDAIRPRLEQDPHWAAAELEKVENTARQTVAEIRTMIFTLRPLVLETQGLAAALEQFQRRMRETHNLDVFLQIQAGVINLLSPTAQGSIFYVIEEAINNARKHAKAEKHLVRFTRQEKYVVVEIQDNGVGFDIEAMRKNYGERGSLGMVNMEERVAIFEGLLNIESAPNKGTRISIFAPIQAGNYSATTPPSGMAQGWSRPEPSSGRVQRPNNLTPPDLRRGPQ
jgi:signal transduction histidine kinase